MQCSILSFQKPYIVARPDAPEGDLSKLRASLVRDESLAELAAELGLGEHLILGSGEKKSGGHRRESILADALEAIFGAVFLDRGFSAAKQVIDGVFEQRYVTLPDAEELRDPKTRLQEWLQSRKMSLPEYELVDVIGEGAQAEVQSDLHHCRDIGSDKWRVDDAPKSRTKGSPKNDRACK